MRKVSKSYREDLLEQLKDPEYAILYLNAALNERDLAVFLIALKDVADAKGIGMMALAKRSRLNRESLYRTLSEEGNPRLESLVSILSALGYHLSIEVDEGKMAV